MFQDYALFPHKNVRQNITFGLEMSQWGSGEIEARLAQVLDLVGLSDYGERDVSTLSGGEQQRAALARSLAPRPRLLMLDEPLGSLDRTLRERLLGELGDILRQTEQTALYVTHDQEEALALANRVVIMKRGQIAQVGSPQAIYRKPSSVFVARFLGFNNVFSGRGQGTHIQTPLGTLPAPEKIHGPVTLLIRPDMARLGTSGPEILTGRVRSRSFRGGFCRMEVLIHEHSLTFDFPSTDRSIPSPGENVQISYNPQDSIQFFKNAND
jgi:ABC-type Fe3+/spermidine/putrescine transport system ATPase subunit